MATRSRHRIAVVLLAAATWGCSEASRSPERVYERAEELRRAGDLAGALQQAERGYAVWIARPQSLWQWKFRLLTAEILLSQHNWKKAAPLLSQSYAGVQDPEIPARIFAARGRSLYEQGDQARARENLDRALALATRASPAALVPEIRLRRATVMVRTGDNEAAMADTGAALEAARAGGDRYMETNALAQMGFLLLQSYRYDEAIAWFERAIAISRPAGYGTVTALIVDNLGWCYYRLGDLDKARDYFTEAEKRLAERHDDANRQIALGNLGSLRYSLEDYAGARSYFEQALAIATRLQDGFHEAQWLDNIASAYLQAADAQAAEPYVARALKLKAGSTDASERAWAYLNAAEIALRQRDFERAGRLYEEGLTGRPADPDAQWQLRAGMGFRYSDAGDPGRAQAEFAQAIGIIKSSWSRLLNDQSKLTFPSRAMRFYRKYVEFLMSQKRAADALAFVESSRALLLAETAGDTAAPSFPDVARRRNAALLSYWVAPGRSYAWIAAPAGFRSVELPSQERICSLVERQAAAVLENRESPAAEELYAMLVAPMSALLPPGGRVILVPDGCLHRLNFETLMTPARRYWIEDATVEIAPSLRLLGAPPRTQARGKSILLIGDPLPSDRSLASLPYAAQELSGIASLYGDAMTVSREHATPEAYAAAGPSRFSVIHFAAHAVPNRDSPLDSAIVLSPGRDTAKLYTREVRRVPLSANLVTVSACQSAGAKAYAGEGLVGFAWAFLAAGARNVIASLWDVSDRSTDALMQAVYARVRDTGDPAEALRAVKLQFLHSDTANRKPYYWAPFQVYVR